jgi:hypothetical protein
MDYQEVPDEDVKAGETLLEAAAMGEIPAYAYADYRLIFELTHGKIYSGWHCWRVEREGDHLLVDGVELMTWIEERKRDPGWDEMNERSFRLRSIRRTPRCLIGSFRHVLLRRAANGEPVRIETGEQESYRHTWIVEGDVWTPLWKGTEEQWRAELCDPDAPDAWPYCRRLCHRRPTEY